MKLKLELLRAEHEPRTKRSVYRDSANDIPTLGPKMLSLLLEALKHGEASEATLNSFNEGSRLGQALHFCL